MLSHAVSISSSREVTDKAKFASQPPLPGDLDAIADAQSLAVVVAGAGNLAVPGRIEEFGLGHAGVPSHQMGSPGNFTPKRLQSSGTLSTSISSS